VDRVPKKVVTTTLLALHGFTLNGAVMREQLAPLGLEKHVTLECLDAPHVCPDRAVERLYERWQSERQPPPYLRWWNASDDGRTYVGWAESRELIRERIVSAGAVGVLGFSQGAIVAAALAALSERGELPPIKFAVLIAGRVPRAAEFADAFAWPLDLPTLHVWGERDKLTGPYGAELADCFSPDTREICTWPGPHVVPSRGPAADAIVDFVRRYA
jgi:pimeloyl-ACP methyl ester carboxylesterase